MLASKYRLKSKVNFVRAEIDGKLIQSMSFGVEIFDRKDGEPSRFGFIISTRISKKAVIRNKIKRTMSDELRKNIDKIKEGFDVVFLVKPSIVRLTKDQKLDTDVIIKETNEFITKNLQK
jgi:ribonuclease P protein component